MTIGRVRDSCRRKTSHDASRPNLPDLRTALHSVTAAAAAVLEQLRKAGPGDVTAGFDVDPAVTAGAVITKGSADCRPRGTTARHGNKG
ncbi:CU044_2847 family protein [Streptomyces sp. NPDC048349]|uniref:CU044_2847 family protein n=1 Tax=Streptomyces sp. NPDC048349 TaxID=3155486 RepID=UPI003422CD1C